MTEQVPSEELIVIKYYANHDLGMVAVGDSFGPPEGEWAEVSREECDRLHRLGYTLEGDIE